MELHSPDAGPDGSGAECRNRLRSGARDGAECTEAAALWIAGQGRVQERGCTLDRGHCTVLLRHGRSKGARRGTRGQESRISHSAENCTIRQIRHAEQPDRRSDQITYGHCRNR